MKCPGQDSRYWQPGAIFEAKCPECGNAVEFFKDDVSRKCKNCGHMFLNPNMDFGCASYCRHAEQCIGGLSPELIAQKQNLLKDRVAIEMKRYFNTDFKRIGHAGRVARYAEKLAKEEGGDIAVILISAYLHDIGIKEAERKHNSSAAVFQEEEGPPVAKMILERLGAGKDLVNEVCDIIGHHHHPRKEETLNFKILHDADSITNLEEKQKDKPFTDENIHNIIKKSFLTGSGRKLAEEVLFERGK